MCVFFNAVPVFWSCRPPPPIQETQREARQATFLFHRGLKVDDVGKYCAMFVQLNVLYNHVVWTHFYSNCPFTTVSFHRYKHKYKRQILILLRSELASECFYILVPVQKCQISCVVFHVWGNHTKDINCWMEKTTVCLFSLWNDASSPFIHQMAEIYNQQWNLDCFNWQPHSKDSAWVGLTHIHSPFTRLISPVEHW